MDAGLHLSALAADNRSDDIQPVMSASTTMKTSVAAQQPPPFPLPPPAVPGRKTLFLDLDKTLVSTRTCLPWPTWKYDFSIPRNSGNRGEESFFYVVKRPGVDEFLRIAAKSFEVVIFTAGTKAYASAVIDRLDPGGVLIAHRLYRDSCRLQEDGGLVKDLSGLGRDLAKVLIVDDVPRSYAMQKANGVAVAPFDDTKRICDRELRRVRNVLELAAGAGDTRVAIAFYNLCLAFDRALMLLSMKRSWTVQFLSRSSKKRRRGCCA